MQRIESRGPAPVAPNNFTTFQHGYDRGASGDDLAASVESPRRHCPAQPADVAGITFERRQADG